MFASAIAAIINHVEVLLCTVSILFTTTTTTTTTTTGQPVLAGTAS